MSRLTPPYLKAVKTLTAIVLGCSVMSTSDRAAGAHTYAFAGDQSTADATVVAPATPYTAARGFGFERPGLFSVKVPEGNYRVTLVFDGSPGSDLTVKAESRRVMLERVPCEGEGKPLTREIVVNVRTPSIAGNGAGKPDGAVKLNDREIASPSWDDRLSLEFIGSARVRSVRVEPAPGLPTVFIAGDSTVTDQADEPWTGWGQVLPLFFKPTVAVANYAESGRSLKSFAAERRLDKILSVIRPGDYLFIQFGHNDQKEKGDGVGAFTTFKASLEQYVKSARDRGATPVIVTPMYRRRFTDGKLQESLGDFPAAMRQVAQEQKVALIDLHESSGKLFQAMGTDGTLKAFVHYPAGTFPGQAKALKDDTHFNGYGGYELARCVVEAIRTSGLPLAKELNDRATPFDPSSPEDPAAAGVPASPARPIATPAGS